VNGACRYGLFTIAHRHTSATSTKKKHPHIKAKERKKKKKILQLGINPAGSPTFPDPFLRMSCKVKRCH
jgi:hypothetical protein